MPERPPPEECANCGTSLRRNARACPECGADERTGWRESSDNIYDGLDLPNSAYADENTTDSSHRPALREGIAWYWYLVAFVLLLLLIASAVGLR
jgi:predicted amidophosphoribosyltransferase